MRYLPIFIDLKERPVVVVGGGEEALRKVRLLIKTQAKIGVVALRLHEELQGLVDNGRIEWIGRQFVPILLDDAALIYSADETLNESVSAAARERGIPVNAVDDAALSSFIVPAIVDRDPLVVAIGTEGAAPVLAQGIRTKIDRMLPAALGQLARAAEALRARVAESVPAGGRRRGFWQRFFFGDVRESFLANNSDSYERALDRILKNQSAPAEGRVALVGAGPGDPELLTLKAHRKLQEADVIVHDRLVGPDILELARRDAVRIPVAKTPRQGEIAAILIREAKAGRHVVRLVLGRGGAERAALEANGIAVDVVPGVAALPGPATPKVSADIVPFPVRDDIRDAALRAAS
jgi:uroporphyrin-III C-methyltransferase / precorrin-2 dehydrogenase / sirohydrochlorin ferrochelatase